MQDMKKFGTHRVLLLYKRFYVPNVPKNNSCNKLNLLLTKFLIIDESVPRAVASVVPEPVD